jgi:hypothetical protein
MRRLILVFALLTSGVAVAADSSTFQLRNADDLVVAQRAPDHALYAMRRALSGLLVGAYSYYNDGERREPLHLHADPGPDACQGDERIRGVGRRAEYMNDPRSMRCSGIWRKPIRAEVIPRRNLETGEPG